MVDAVNNNNNNRTTYYTLGGLGVGAAAGAAYSDFVSKPLLKGDAPSDAFVRTLHDKQAKSAVETAEKTAKDAVAKFTTVDEMKAEIKANASKYGLAEIKGEAAVVASEGVAAKPVVAAKSLEDVVADYLKKEGGEALDAAGLKAKMETSAVTVAKGAAESGIIEGKVISKAITDSAALADDATDDVLKTFIKNNKEAFSLVDDATDAVVDTKFQELIGGVTAQADKVKALKTETGNLFKGAKDAIADNWDSKGGLKALAESASEADKSIFNTIKSAANEVRLKAAGKWALGVGAVLGLAAYIGAKMTQPKPEMLEAQNLEAHQA